MKKYFTIALVTLAFALFGGLASAQSGGGMGGSGTHGSMQSPGSGQQSMMGQGMVDNMAMMSEMMNEMHQLMTQSQLTQEHQRQMMDMMNQMGRMMQQMAGPKGRSMDEQHSNQLHEMEKRLDTIKDQMGK